MKIIFAGTPEFAAIALKALLDSPHQIVAVLTQPDRPSGRGLKLTASPVKMLAETMHVPLYQPATLKNPEQQNILATLQADVMVVAAYGLILPKEILHLTPLGCINIHPSLLPRWRGAAPIQRTIYAGDRETGVTIMQMDEGLDTGPMLLKKSIILTGNETSQILHDQLAALGAEAVLETLDLLSQQQIHPHPQDDRLATYAYKITKEEALIDWHRPAVELEREIRAFNPKPVAFTMWRNQPLRIWLAKVIPGTPETPGILVHASKEGIDIATQQGILRLLQLQLPGGKILSCADFYNAKQHELAIGKPFV